MTGSGSENQNDDSPLTAAEFYDLLMSRGFPLSEIDNWNTGDLIDWAKAHDRNIRIANGEEVKDPYDQYKNLKAMEPEIERLHAEGKIKEIKYQSYRQTLENCEKQLRE